MVGHVATRRAPGYLMGGLCLSLVAFDHAFLDDRCSFDRLKGHRWIGCNPPRYAASLEWKVRLHSAPCAPFMTVVGEHAANSAAATNAPSTYYTVSTQKDRLAALSAFDIGQLVGGGQP